MDNPRLVTFYALKEAITVMLGRIQLAQMSITDAEHERHLLLADRAGHRVREAVRLHENALLGNGD